MVKHRPSGQGALLRVPEPFTAPRNNRFYAPLFLAVCLSAFGCATSPVTETVAPPSLKSLLVTDRFGARPALPDGEAIHQLSAEQITTLQAYLSRPALRYKPLHRRVADYLDQLTTNFSYDERTLAARDAYALQSGNCMSLAVLTTALAQVAEVDIEYELMNESPVFQWQGDLLLNGQHLRSVLLEPTTESDTMMTIRSGIEIDYFPTGSSRYVRRVSHNEYLSMFYNNLAVQALAEADYGKTYWLLREALSLQPENGDTLNTLALLFRRAGDAKRSEDIYQAALRATPNAVVILRNYRSLLTGQNRMEEAQALSAALLKLEDVSPIDWLRAGTREYATGNYNDAANYFKKALGIAPHLHEANLGLAQTYYAMKDNRNTRQQLELALKNAQRNATRSLYQAKLNALSRASQ